jgi:hypothetical protein
VAVFAWYFYQILIDFGFSTSAWLRSNVSSFDFDLARDLDFKLRWIVAGTTASLVTGFFIARVYIACRRRLMREDLEEYIEKSQFDQTRSMRGMTAPL